MHEIEFNQHMGSPQPIDRNYLQNWLNNKSIHDQNYHHNNQYKNYYNSHHLISESLYHNQNSLTNKLKFNMAPISEKRLPIIKENTKENITTSSPLRQNQNSRLSAPTIEILDFRESWLQEIEMYKDQVRAQQLLTAHNHFQTPEYYHQKDSIINSSPPNGNIKRNESSKRRNRTKSDSETVDLISRHYEDERAREDLPNSNINYNRNENIVVIDKSSIKNNVVSSSLQNASLKSTSIAAAVNGQTEQAAIIAPKTIVNPYHVSLLNNHELDKHLKQVQTIKKASTNNKLNKQYKHHKSKSPKESVNKNSNFNIDGGNGGSNYTKNKVVDVFPIQEVEKQNNNDEQFTSLPQIDLEAINTNINGTLDDDSASNNDNDDFDFGDIDDTDLAETTDDSDDEYTGCPYILDSDKSKKLMGEQASTEYYTPTSPFAPSLFPQVPPYLTFASHVEKAPQLPPELQKILKWRLSPVMPRIVRRVVGNSGFRLIKKTNDWVASWEKHMKSPCFKSIRSHQKFNHLPGTFKIGRKDSVWRNIRSFIKKHGKKEFGFMQKTYILPQDLGNLRKAWPRYAKKGTKWIIKPPASARGAGIKVISRWTDFPKQKPLIVQKYIERPLLINGSKFDLRLYVVVTSINPLRIFLHTDGLARFAAVQYSDNVETLNDRCMHLTNYSINKFSQNYSKNEDINACQGHKWTLKSLWSYFEERGIDTKTLWGTLRNLVIKTVIGGESCLNRMYKCNVGSRYNCYELFGFDVLLDENLVPWLLEVNISPSLHSDLPLDLHVKGPLIQAVLNSALYQVPPKLTSKQEQNIKNIYNLKGNLCFDRRIFTTCLTTEELKKHTKFTSRENIESREDYIDTILDDLTPDDLRCLIIAEDELARSAPLERIFPTSQSYIFMNFIEGPRYYNRLLDAWETKYGQNRKKGIQLLQSYCEKGIHLEVSPLAMDNEPTIEVDIFEMNTAIRNANKQQNAATTLVCNETKAPVANNVEKHQHHNAQNCAQQENKAQPINEISLINSINSVEVK